MAVSRRYRLNGWKLFAAAVSGAIVTCAWASEDGTAPLYEAPYATVLGRYQITDDGNALGNGFGGTLGVGLRKGPIGFEARVNYTSQGSGASTGGSFNGLVFPFQRIPGLYGTFGIGLENISGYPGVGNNTFNLTALDGGVGYIFPLQIGHYQFGLRGEALYQYGKREKREQDQPAPTIDLPVESNFHDVIVQVGLQLPFGWMPVPAPPPPEPPVQVVPAEPVPPAPPPAPPPPCQAPTAGQPIDFGGCKTGDTIVLHGVNFEFNKANLTPNAKALLDQVASALQAHNELDVEVGGHTDGKGSASYNLKLSEERAASVKDYLVSRGVDAGHLSRKGFGMTMPVADNNTDEGRELNRRVELKIVGGGAATALPDAAATPADTATVNDAPKQ